MGTAPAAVVATKGLRAPSRRLSVSPSREHRRSWTSRCAAGRCKRRRTHVASGACSSRSDAHAGTERSPPSHGSGLRRVGAVRACSAVAPPRRLGMEPARRPQSAASCAAHRSRTVSGRPARSRSLTQEEARGCPRDTASGAATGKSADPERLYAGHRPDEDERAGEDGRRESGHLADRRPGQGAPGVLGEREQQSVRSVQRPHRAAADDG